MMSRGICLKANKRVTSLCHLIFVSLYTANFRQAFVCRKFFWWSTNPPVFGAESRDVCLKITTYGFTCKELVSANFDVPVRDNFSMLKNLLVGKNPSLKQSFCRVIVLKSFAK